MIGITFALPRESANLRRQLSEIRQDGDLISGRIDHREVAIVHTGVGAKNCNERLEVLLHKARPKLVIGSGFAGAIVNDLHVSELVLGENFSDRQLLATAERILQDRHLRIVKLFTSTAIVDSVVERNEIARRSGAEAVDMETGAIAGVCNAHGVPLLSLRAISDSPTEPFPVAAHILFDIEQQRPNYGRLAVYLLRDPASVPKLLRFSKHIAQAREKLTKAILSLVRAI